MAENRQYDHEYKVQAVKLAKEIGQAKAAKELGVPQNTMYGWVRANRIVCRVRRNIVERLLCASEYGISLFSYDVMAEFLKVNRVRSEKLLTTFQKKKKLYLDAIGRGVFFPMPQINHFDYAIRFAGMDEPFGDEWERKINYDGFNITVKNGLWVTGFEELEYWDARGYDGSEGSYEQYGGIIQNFYTPTHIYYLDGDRKQTNSAFKIDIPDGKYLLKVEGFVHKDFEVNKNHIGKCGFYFTLDKTDAFTECKNPREKDDYAFNIGSM